MSSPLHPPTGSNGPPDDVDRGSEDGQATDAGRHHDLDRRPDPDPTHRGVDGSDPGAVTLDSRDLRHAQQERFGGIKFGSAFFGWLTATGMAVVLIALLTAAGVVFGIADDAQVATAVDAAGQPTQQAQTVGLVGGIVFLVVLLLAYYCGGYVAGRMARFNGVRQGVAVWIWGVVIALVVAAVAAIAGSQYDVLAQLNLPRLPVNEGQVTTVGAIVIGAALLVALVGALLGGLAGMRFHRKVDRAIDDTTVSRPPR